MFLCYNLIIIWYIQKISKSQKLYQSKSMAKGVLSPPPTTVYCERFTLTAQTAFYIKCPLLASIEKKCSILGTKQGRNGIVAAAWIFICVNVNKLCLCGPLYTLYSLVVYIGWLHLACLLSYPRNENAGNSSQKRHIFVRKSHQICSNSMKRFLVTRVHPSGELTFHSWPAISLFFCF